MSRYLLAAIVILVVWFPMPVSACGSVFKSFSAMMLEADKDRLESFLTAQSCNEPAEYSPNNADQYIALVLMHAVQARVSVNIVESVFAKYHCVAKLRPYSGHRQIVDYIGGARVNEICPEDEVRRLYVVAADGGANLRVGPTSDSQKIRAIAEGVAVENGRIEGEWIRVDTFMGTGYMHESTLRKYLPERSINHRLLLAVCCL